MKYRLLRLLFIFFCLSFGTLLWAQSDGDIELTDSTSVEWGGGSGGGLNPQTPTDPVTELTISQTTLTLEGGEVVRLVATVNQRAKNKKVLWSSANEQIATVDAAGRVMGLGIGSTTITVTAAGNTSLKQTCTVTVTSDYVPPVSGYILPWGRDEAWTMKYFQVDYSMDSGDTSWILPSFDDSKWPTLTGPMGNDGTRNYQWDGEWNGFKLRCTFDMPIVREDVIYTFYAIHDDDLWVYLNGELIVHFDGCSNWQERSVVIPAQKFVRGKNQLALCIMQGSGGSYLDYSLYQKSPRKATQARLPNVPFEFYYNAKDYSVDDQCIPNQLNANLKGASLQLTAHLPELVDNDLLRLNDRCEGYIDFWSKGSTESGAYFYREGQDCMTLVAKVAPRLDAGSCDFLTNRGGGYNYMWRIGDENSSYLHTGTAYQSSRSLVLTSEQPQILAVRVNGPEDYILLENLTTGEKKQIQGINWGGGNNVFKLFYNDDGEYYKGDLYWVYYSFELLTDAQMEVFKEKPKIKGDVNGDGAVNIADVAAVLNIMAGSNTNDGDVNGDGAVNIADVAAVLNIMAGN